MKERVNSKFYFKVIGIAAAIALSITGYMVVEGQSYEPADTIKSGLNNTNNTSLQKPDSTTPIRNVEPKPLMVQISGCVKEPGIYTMQEGQRVVDAIELAGGVTMEIDDKSINLVAKVKDGQKIYFQPKKIDISSNNETSNKKEEGENTDSKTPRQETEKININTANVSDLKRLPGIGDYYANKIMDYRKANGPFPDIGSIIKVSGIGAARFEQIKAYISVK